MNEKSLLSCPSGNRAVFARLFLFAIVSSMALIANPGLFRNDEFYLLSDIQGNGFAYYLSTYVSLEPVQAIANFVRPVSFLVQGLVFQALPEYPFLVHLADVLMHALAAMLLFSAIVRFCGQRKLAFLSAILFIISPLAVFSTGWTAALTDRLFIIFGLWAFVAAHDYITEKKGQKALVALFFASLLAMLSKETAMVLPAVLAVYWFFPWQAVNPRRIWTALIIWSIPVLLLMLNRFLHLAENMGGSVGTAYKPAISNIPETLSGYLLYPFLPFNELTREWLVQPAYCIAAAAACHLLLCFLIVRTFSFRALWAYLAGYMLFLLPILMFDFTLAHYLYGSAIAFSIALAALLISAQKRLYLYLVAGLIALVTLHTVVVQLYFYKHGLCMNTMLASLKTAYEDNNRPDSMSILVIPRSPINVLRSYVKNRKSPTEFSMVLWNKRQEGGDYVFDCDCTVRKRPELLIDIKDWGPRSASLNQPLQPNGAAAFWIKTKIWENMSDLEVLLDGQPALKTTVSAEIITANFAPERLAKPGNYRLEIRQVASGKKLRVGTFIIKPE